MFLLLIVFVGLENRIYHLRQNSQKLFNGTLSWLIPANMVVLLLAGFYSFGSGLFITRLKILGGLQSFMF